MEQMRKLTPEEKVFDLGGVAGKCDFDGGSYPKGVGPAWPDLSLFEVPNSVPVGEGLAWLIHNNKL